MAARKESKKSASKSTTKKSAKKRGSKKMAANYGKIPARLPCRDLAGRFADENYCA